MQKKSSYRNTANQSRSMHSGGNGIESSQLMKLFETELKDVYWAEKALTKAIPKMIKNATSQELIGALEGHLVETEEHVSRLEEVFEQVGKKPVAKKCEAMAGLLEEGEELMKDCDDGPMRDAGIIAAGQKVEHYEIATYGTLRAWAESLDLPGVVDLLQRTLDEEKAADEKLSEVALTAVNVEAMMEEKSER